MKNEFRIGKGVRRNLKAGSVVVMLAASVSCMRSNSETSGGASGDAVAPKFSDAAGTPSSSADFLDRWDKLALSADGAKPAEQHAKLLAEAVGGLGEGSALGEFIEGLHDRRETAIADEVLSKHKKAMFSGKNGVETREWLLGVKDGDFKKMLCFEAGYFFTGPGLKEYFEMLSPEAARERFLTGYASRLAESDPARAVSEYKALRLGKCSMYGLLDVMERLSPDGDFPAADALYADDYDEANNMGAALRQKLLRRWATFHPEAAAKYVADTPKRVKPESIRVVIAKWAETKPEDALAWLENSPAGPLRDAGLTELAKIVLKAGKPSDAWKAASQIGDTDKRQNSANDLAFDKVVSKFNSLQLQPQRGDIR